MMSWIRRLFGGRTEERGYFLAVGDERDCPASAIVHGRMLATSEVDIPLPQCTSDRCLCMLRFPVIIDGEDFTAKPGPATAPERWRRPHPALRKRDQQAYLQKYQDYMEMVKHGVRLKR